MIELLLVFVGLFEVRESVTSGWHRIKPELEHYSSATAPRGTACRTIEQTDKLNLCV